MKHEFSDVENNLNEIAGIIEAEVNSISRFLRGGTYDMVLFKPPVIVAASVEEKDFGNIPRKEGLYVFRVTADFDEAGYNSLKTNNNSSKVTILRNGIECSGLRKDSILYVGSTKSMGIRARLKEHLIRAGNGVYSLGLFEKSEVKKKIEVICFEMNSLESADQYAKFLLTCIEEKLQKEMKPAAGRYRG